MSLRATTRIAIPLASIVLTVFCAASIHAQTPTGAAVKTDQATDSTKADKDKKGGPLFAVAHDATLQGDGSNESPLGITDSPTVPGSLTVNGDVQADRISSRLVSVSNGLAIAGPTQASTTSGNAIEARGGDSTLTSLAGDGVKGMGGDGFGNFEGGNGVTGIGGNSANSGGGFGLLGQGGQGGDGSGAGVLGLGGHPGGFGVIGIGGGGERGGNGMSAFGGPVGNASGGNGIDAHGGAGNGAGNAGGIGIIAEGGLGENGAVRGLAARFDGDVVVTGKLVKGSGSFKIDHPLDPANKYLSHSFVESPDMMNIYNGNVTTDANGDATVQLPGYFSALNRDFRYQLTVIGTFAQSIVAEKLRDNHFRIKTSVPNVEVSWQVTGIRQDAFANTNRIPVEEDKPAAERGLYLHPDALGEPAEKSVVTAQAPQPQAVRQLKITVKSPEEF